MKKIIIIVIVLVGIIVIVRKLKGQSIDSPYANMSSLEMQALPADEVAKIPTEIRRKAALKHNNALAKKAGFNSIQEWQDNKIKEAGGKAAYYASTRG